jgi:beta-aspartyl-dipeptidase (metallo-type)
MMPNLREIRRVDAAGKSVVPGFIDCHIHFLGAGDYDGPLGRVPAELHLSSITMGGVTTAASLLGLDTDSKNLHALLVKSIELERVGLSTFMYTGSFRLPSPHLTGSVRSDLLLIDRVIGVKISIAEDNTPNLLLNDLAKLAGDMRLVAGMTGKACNIHIHVGRNRTRLQQIFDLLEVVNIPITQIHPTHLNRRSNNLLEHGLEFIRRGGTIDFSAILSERSGSDTGINPDEAVSRIISEGLPLSQVTLSSDANTSMPVVDSNGRRVGLHRAMPTVLLREFVQIVRTNQLTLQQALPLVTTNVARVLRLEKRKGSIAPGKDADVLIMDSDLAVDTVIGMGRVLVENGQPLIKGPWEGADTAVH